ncbi:MAG: hypothetical protein ACYCWW_13035 [Deltaproteobacteria bacterium]
MAVRRRGVWLVRVVLLVVGCAGGCAGAPEPAVAPPDPRVVLPPVAPPPAAPPKEQVADAEPADAPAAALSALCVVAEGMAAVTLGLGAVERLPVVRAQQGAPGN